MFGDEIMSMIDVTIDVEKLQMRKEMKECY
jgi:cyanate lyase